ncbi:MAG: hypothetical protein AAFU85_27255, partial [Planctomycetota bacterium]
RRGECYDQQQSQRIATKVEPQQPWTQNQSPLKENNEHDQRGKSKDSQFEHGSVFGTETDHQRRAVLTQRQIIDQLIDQPSVGTTRRGLDTPPVAFMFKQSSSD